MSTHVPTRNTAFNLLLSLEEAVLLNGSTVPKNTEAREQWSGVRCVVAGMNFIVPLQQVGEILEPRSLTSIPGCAAWIKGLMNVRGRLLPVFGVNEFFGGGRMRNNSFQIIIVEQGAIFCGIAVDKVFGMQKFPQDEFRARNADQEVGLEGIGEYVGPFTVIGSESWYQLDIWSLANRLSHANPSATVTNESRVEKSRPQPVATPADAHTTAEVQGNE